CDLERSILRDEEVGGFDVTVALETAGNGMLHAPAELNRPLESLDCIQRTCSFFQVVGKGYPTERIGGHVLHSEDELLRAFFDPVQLQDVGMAAKADPNESLSLESISGRFGAKNLASEGF